MPTKLTRRADGRYRVKATVGHDAKGAPIIKYFYGETQREANQKKKEYMDGMAVNGDAKSMTVARWINQWLDSYASGGYNTKLTKRSIFNSFKNYLGDKAYRPINEIIPADIQGFARSVSQYSKSHVSKCKYALNMLFKSAKDNGFVARNPCDGCVWDCVQDGKREAVSNDVVQAICEHWQEHTAGIWAMLMLYAGLRPSEAFALQRESITDSSIVVSNSSHFEHGQLVVTPGKTKSEAGQREIPILPPLRPVIEKLPEKGFVCTTTKGQPVSQSAYKRNWATFCNIIGAKIDMYSLRHTYCSMLYDAGVDVKTAQYLMGHADLEVTLKIYTHLSETKKQRSYDALFRYFE